MFHKKLQDYFTGIYGDLGDMTPIVVGENIEGADFNTIMIALNNDFDVNFPYSRILTAEEEELELPPLKKYYTEL